MKSACTEGKKRESLQQTCSCPTKKPDKLKFSTKPGPLLPHASNRKMNGVIIK